MVSSEPLVSVLMATHNGSRFITEAIDSVISQSYQNLELIIIDDASSDGVEKIVESYGDRRIKLVSNQERLGLTKSLNKGIELSRGEYIARIDDDDIWASDQKLSRQVALMQAHPQVAVCGTQNQVINEDGQAMYKWHVALEDAQIRRLMLRRNQMVHSGVLIRRRALEEAGKYDERLRYAQDYELWMRLGLKYRFANLPDVFIKQRVNSRGVTSQNNMRQFLIFLRTAWRYRHDYPGFWLNGTTYGQEFLVNLLPKPVFYKIGAARRYIRSSDEIK